MFEADTDRTPQKDKSAEGFVIRPRSGQEEDQDKTLTGKYYGISHRFVVLELK